MAMPSRSGRLLFSMRTIVQLRMQQKLPDLVIWESFGDMLYGTDTDCRPQYAKVPYTEGQKQCSGRQSNSSFAIVMRDVMPKRVQVAPRQPQSRTVY